MGCQLECFLEVLFCPVEVIEHLVGDVEPVESLGRLLIRQTLVGVFDCVLWHFFLEHALSHVQVQDVQDFVSFKFLVRSQIRLLGFGHVFEACDAARVEVFSVGPFFIFAQFAACDADPLVEPDFFGDRGLLVTLRVSADVGHLHADVNCVPDCLLDLLLFFRCSLLVQFLVVVHHLVSCGSDLQKCNFVLPHL